MKRLSIILFLVFTFRLVTKAQDNNRFREDIQTILKYDEMYQPQAYPIVFTGSSSIRKWDDLERDFAVYRAINRGVGGTVINDITFYAKELIFNYKPRQVVIYVGENDLPDQLVTPDTILAKTVKLFHTIRASLPEVPIAYISIKPSPVRDQYAAKARAANALISKFLSKEKNAVFIDVYSLMLSKTGKSRPELFVSDRLHMNAQGYAIWYKAVKPFLISPPKGN